MKNKISFEKLIVTYHKWNHKDDLRHIPYSGKAMDAIKELIIRRMDERGTEREEIDIPHDWGVKAGNLMVVKSYVDGDKEKPYIQVYTGESWKKSQKYKEKYL